MTEGMYGETVERDSTTADRGSSEISSAIWNGEESRSFLRLFAHGARPGTNLVEGDALIIPPIAGYSDAFPLIRVRLPVPAEGPAGIDTSHIEAIEPRMPASISYLPMGPFGDTGTRYQTPDRGNNGANVLDIDHLGIVRRLTHIDASGVSRFLDLALLDSVQLGGALQSLPGGWQASGSGSGSDTVITIVAPDGRTTYHLDLRGRIIPGRGSVDVTAGPSRVAVDLGKGSSRHESVLADGTVASARVTTDGALSHITLRGRTVTTTITRTQWEAALHGPYASGNIGNGWSIRLLTPADGAPFPSGTARIMHRDGTAYFVTPAGRLVGHLAAYPSRASGRRR